MDDDLLKLFGGNMMSAVFDKGGIDEDTPIQAKMLTKMIENAQMKVEGRNFSARKHVLSYDDVMNVQREIIYSQRREVLDGNDMSQSVKNMMLDSAKMVVDTYSSEIDGADFNPEGLLNEIRTTFNIGDLKCLNDKKVNSSKVLEELEQRVLNAYDQKQKEIGEAFKFLEELVA